MDFWFFHVFGGGSGGNQTVEMPVRSAWAWYGCALAVGAAVLVFALASRRRD